MRVLIVAATFPEIQPFVERFKMKVVQNNFYFTQSANKEIYCLVTGPGILATTCFLTRHLIARKFNLVINAGIAGSFNERYSIGTVVEAITDSLGDFGVDDNGTFITAAEAGFQDANEFPFVDGKLENKKLSGLFCSLSKVNGITMNTATGSKSRMDMLRKKFNPDIESMEGAAFFYTCLHHSVNFAQIRAISNHVEPRNKNNWNISLAITNLNLTLINTFAEEF